MVAQSTSLAMDTNIFTDNIFIILKSNKKLVAKLIEEWKENLHINVSEIEYIIYIKVYGNNT